MTLPRMQPTTPFAPWSLRLLSLAMQLLVLTLVLHRFASLPTAVAINLMSVAFAACAVAALVGLTGLVQIWRHGSHGAGAATASLLFGAALLIIPAYYVPGMMHSSGGYDVSTDGAQPPVFRALAKARANAGLVSLAAGASEPPGELVIAPIQTTRSPGDVFDLANEVVKQLDLNIVAEEAPGFGEADGTLEATERTLLLGLTDDIAIRIGTRGVATRIDVRSAARYPRLDLGRNWQRVQLIVQKLQASLDASVPTDGNVTAEAGDATAEAAKSTAGSGGVTTGLRRKKRGPAQANAQGGPIPTTSRH